MIRLCTALLLLFHCAAAVSETLNGFDVSNSLLPPDSIVHGGPPRDGIPAILSPHYVSAAEASFMRPGDTVLGLVIEDSALAYPRHILNWHELVNDKLGSHTFLVSYCPLCGTGMTFSSKVKGAALVFGVSGLLFNNDVLFYDKTTESLWSQIERRAISGPLAGESLQQLPMVITTWQSWLKQHPATRVLSETQGVKRNYRHDPYSGYETSSQLFFKTLRQTPKDFHTKERVLGVLINAEARAYPFSELKKAEEPSFQQTLGGTEFRVFWDEQAESVVIRNSAGELLPSTVAYWFAWYNFHPETSIFRAQGEP